MIVGLRTGRAAPQPVAEHDEIGSPRFLVCAVEVGRRPRGRPGPRRTEGSRAHREGVRCGPSVEIDLRL